MGIKDFSKEVVRGLVNESYLVACNHGFHDEKKSVDHWIMLVISEVGELIDAHRKGYYSFIEQVYPKMVEVEEWRPIIGFNDYEVSSFGRVRSKDMLVWNGKRKYLKRGRVLRAGLTKTGYLTVSLRGITRKVSILVADAFLGKKNPSDIVNHIDGNKLNNNLGNLEYVSPSDNNRHALRTGLRKPVNGKLSYEDRVYIAFQHKMGRKYTSILKDKDFGVTKSAVQRVCNEYKKYTDSVEFEMADVCIRLYDLCGTLGIMPVHHSSEAMQDMFGDFVDILGSYSLTERCKVLCELLCQCNNDMELEETDDYEGSETISFWIGAALCLVYCMAQDMGIDLLKHIRLKMLFNDDRPRLNGKKY